MAVMPVITSPATTSTAPRANDPVGVHAGADQAQRGEQPGGEHGQGREATAAASGARRPTTPAATSSKRPSSSSLRVCRRTIAKARNAVKRLPIMTVLRTPMPGGGGGGERAVERGQGRVVGHHRGAGRRLGVGRVEVEGGDHRPVGGGHQREDAGQDDPAVAAPGQPQEGPGAGQGGHADTSSGPRGRPSSGRLASADRIAVLREEQLLQGGRLAGEGLDAVAAEPLQDVTHGAGLDGQDQALAVLSGGVHAGPLRGLGLRRRGG